MAILSDMSRQHVIRLDLMAVVFLGGCVGTGLRYALSTASGAGSFHVGTIAANMLACFVYATLSAVEEFTLLRTSAVAGAIVYCLTTFVAGFVIAYAGACLGSALVHCGKADV